MSTPQLTQFVKRPGVGRAGGPENIRSNFFPITGLPNKTIYHYDISISSDMPPALNRRLFSEWVSAYKQPDLAGSNPVFDCRKNMISSRELPFESRTFDVSLCEDGIPRPNRPIPVFKVKVKKVAVIQFKELERFLEGKAPATPGFLTAIQSLDFLIRHKPAMLHATIGGSFFTTDGSATLQRSLEAWRGFYSSARPTSDDLCRANPPLNWVEVGRSIKHLRVTMTHRRGSPRGYPITGLARRSAFETTFTMTNDNGQEQENFCRRIFQTSLQPHSRQSHAALCHRLVGREQVVPIEVCKVLSGKRYTHKLSEIQMADMIKFTSQNSTARANTLKSSPKMLNYRDNEYLKDVGMAISEDMIQIPARVLPAPTVCYRSDSQQPNIAPQDGKWNLKGRKFVQGAKLES
ncbi:hypothetical protein MVEG_09668 [Podila verticillata NRRL 6337]|nr:hypothetical protein MVEG_09668 [Podila verticillata NRRL 6337]